MEEDKTNEDETMKAAPGNFSKEWTEYRKQKLANGNVIDTKSIESKARGPLVNVMRTCGLT